MTIPLHEAAPNPTAAPVSEPLPLSAQRLRHVTLTPGPLALRSGHAAAALKSVPSPITPDQLRPFQDRLTLPPVVDLTPYANEETLLTMPIVAADVHLSSQLPPTAAWTYAGSLPGPTVFVRRGQTVRVDWTNDVKATEMLPCAVSVSPDPAAGQLPFQNTPGPDPGGQALLGADMLTASTVVHLHGGRTSPDSDGWTENVAVSGQAQRAAYGNDQPATMLWYHDHAMGVTRLNVYAGLAGLWMIRDGEEDALTDGKQGVLPGHAFEMPLLIQDRNLDLNADGTLSGRLLHKSETSTAEFFGPYALVNGTLWPYSPVDARPYRLRLLNGCNARTLCLRLGIFDDQDHFVQDVTQDIWQVGTDGGLLDHPVRPPAGGLLLASAERADLVVDFGALARSYGTLAVAGTLRLGLVNIAFAPFHNNTVVSPGGEVDQNGNTLVAGNPGDASPAMRLPFPNVMRFDVDLSDTSAPASLLTDATPLSASFTRYVHGSDAPAGRKVQPIGPHKHRWIALTEFPTGMLKFRELEPVTTDATTAAATGLPLIAIQTPVPANPQHPGGPTTLTTWYRTTAMNFHDAERIFVEKDGWEVWNIINLTVDAHPFHVHLVEYQALHRQACSHDGYDDGGGFTQPGQPIVVTDLSDDGLDANEQGFKDTIRVNPNEVLAIAAKFEGFAGRYMYHCHILEHEDHDMMRPFVVVPADAMALMPDMGMGGMAM